MLPRCCWQWDLLPHCELLLGREPPPSRRDSPQWGRSRDRAGRQGAAVVTSCGETTTWVTLAPPGVWPICGGSCRRPSSSAHCPLPSQLWMPSKHPARPQKLTVELGYLEGRVGVSPSEQMKTGEQRRPVPRPGGGEWVGGVTEAIDQSFSTTSAEGLGMYKFILLFLNFLAMWHTRSS